MAELKIDINGIKNKVIPPLNNAKTKLEEAANSLSAISYSPDYYKFKNRSRVQSVLPQNIRNIKKDVNKIGNWLGDIETKFKNADKKNNSAVNSLLSKLDKINLSNNMGKTGGSIVGVAAQSMAIKQDSIKNFAQSGFNLAETVATGINSVGAVIGSVWDSLYSNILKPGVDFFADCKAKVCNFVTGIVNEISNGINKIKDGITLFAQKGWEKICGIAQSVGDAFNSVGAHISSAWNSFCTEVWPNIWDGIQSLIASVSNVVIGLVKGLCQFVESLVDVVVILGTAIGSIGTGIYDGISYLVSLANGTSDEWQSATGAMWQWTMGFVAEDHVGNAFEDFYKNNPVGQWLDKYAVDICKSDGIVTNIASGIGYVAGIIILTLCTLGVGTAISGGATTMSFAATSATIATAAGTGKYTQESWGKSRDSSWEGIERLYKKGKITEKEYNTYVSIKNMTDEEWEEIKRDYKNGKITKEQFEQIKQIRKMPDDWKTFENGWKGLLYGVANGVWEGVQWYIGGKLASWAIKGHKIATSAVRVGADTAFNGLDTPFRTIVDSVASGKTWEQAWEQQGGWSSVLTSVGIGLVGSLGGEAFDVNKIRKGMNILNNSKFFDDLDDVTSRKIKQALMDSYTAGDIELEKIINQIDEFKKLDPDAKIAINDPKVFDFTPIDANGDVLWDIYAPNRGKVMGSEKFVDALANDCDRYGGLDGYYLGKQTDSYESRGMPYKNPNEHHLLDTSNVTIKNINEKYRISDPNVKKKILEDMALNRALRDEDIAKITRRSGLTKYALKTILTESTPEEIADVFPTINARIEESIAAPTINSKGGAIQYFSPISIKTLIDIGLIDLIE